MADPGQWSAAASVLVRAVVFDRLRVDHPAVSRLLNVLAPIAEAELAHEAVPPRDILRVGLKILFVVAGLCRRFSFHSRPGRLSIKASFTVCFDV
jgi:hypothetical protein